MIVLTKTTQESVIQLILQEHCHPVCIDDHFEATYLHHYPMNVYKTLSSYIRGFNSVSCFVLSIII